MTTKENTVREQEMPGGNSFRRLILAVIADLTLINELTQDSRMTTFPDVPEFGGNLTTRKGSYFGRWTDAETPVAQWVRVGSGTIHSPGDTIPTTI